MSYFTELYYLLCSHNAVLLAGWLIGSIEYLLSERLLTNPLLTLFEAVWMGFFCALGAIIVADLLPRKIACIIPLLAVYYAVDVYRKRRLMNELQSSGKIVKTLGENVVKGVPKRKEPKYSYAEISRGTATEF